MRRSRRSALGITTAGVLALGGCASGSAADSTDSSGAAEYEPVTVSSCDHEEAFDEPPERVVVNATSLVEELAALGVSDRVVGYAPVSAYSPLDEYSDDVADAPKLGDGPLSREVVTAQDPDLFYSQLNYEDNMIEQYSPLDIPVLFPRKACVDDVTTNEDGERDYVTSTYDDLTDLGRIFDVPDRADDLVDSLKDDMADAREAAADDTSLTVANVGFYSGVNKPFSVADDGIMDQLIDVAGGTNVYGDLPEDGNSEMGPESLIERNPDVIIIRDLPSNGGGYEEVKNFLRNDPRFRDIPAVEHDRFTCMKVEEWYAGIQFPNAAKRFAEVLRDASTEQ